MTRNRAKHINEKLGCKIFDENEKSFDLKLIKYTQNK